MNRNRGCSVVAQSVRKRAYMIGINTGIVVRSAMVLSVAYKALSVRKTEAISCLYMVGLGAALNTLSPLV